MPRGNLGPNSPKAVDSFEPEDTYDYVFIVVRKNQVSELLPALAINRSPNIVFMFNNLSGPDEYVRALGTARYGGFCFRGRKEGRKST